MFRQKKSFFEKLTGSVNLDEEEAVNTPVIKNEKKDWLEEDNADGELSVDVYQTPTEIVVQAMIAGVKPEELDIDITRDMITVHGERHSVSESSDNDYYHQELYWGSFSRTIMLPCEVEVEEAEAIEKHGLLTIRLPKINKGKTQKVRVKSI